MVSTDHPQIQRPVCIFFVCICILPVQWSIINLGTPLKYSVFHITERANQYQSYRDRDWMNREWTNILNGKKSEEGQDLTFSMDFLLCVGKQTELSSLPCTSEEENPTANKHIYCCRLFSIAKTLLSLYTELITSPSIVADWRNPSCPSASKRERIIMKMVWGKTMILLIETRMHLYAFSHESHMTMEVSQDSAGSFA